MAAGGALILGAVVLLARADLTRGGAGVRLVRRREAPQPGPPAPPV
jgi:hypothetical protein